MALAHLTPRRGGLLLLLLVLLSAIWLGWQALHVRDDLTIVRSDATAIRLAATAGDIPQAQRLLGQVRTRIQDAQDRTNDPIWRLGASVPLAGADLAATRQATRAAGVLAETVLPDVERLTELVHTGQLLKAGTVQLGELPQITSLLDHAYAGSLKAAALLRHAPRPHLAVVRKGINALEPQVNQLRDDLGRAATASHLLPAMLGRDKPRRYVLAIQNNAEARATGGLVGAFAIVVADHGRISLEHSGTDSDLQPPKTPIRLPADAATPLLRIGSDRFSYNLNRTPHFPDAATVLAGSWTAQTGEPVDGVLALDPISIRELLRPAGRLNLTPTITVGADDIVDFILRREYTLYPTGADVPARKTLLIVLAKGLFQAVLAGGGGQAQLRAVAAAGQTGHLFVWSAHPTEQAILAPTLVGGALPPDDRDFLEVLTQNNGGNKLDVYLHRTLTVTRRPDSRLDVRLQISNTAPTTGLPPYVTVRADAPDPPVPAGQARVEVAFYGALSTQIDQVRLDDTSTVMSFFTDHGHDVGRISVEIPPGSTHTVDVIMTEPPGTLTYRQQPLATPDTIHITVPHTTVGR